MERREREEGERGGRGREDREREREEGERTGRERKTLQAAEQFGCECLLIRGESATELDKMLSEILEVEVEFMVHYVPSINKRCSTFCSQKSFITATSPPSPLLLSQSECAGTLPRLV